MHNLFSVSAALSKDLNSWNDNLPSPSTSCCMMVLSTIWLSCNSESARPIRVLSVCANSSGDTYQSPSRSYILKATAGNITSQQSRANIQDSTYKVLRAVCQRYAASQDYSIHYATLHKHLSSLVYSLPNDSTALMNSSKLRHPSWSASNSSKMRMIKGFPASSGTD